MKPSLLNRNIVLVKQGLIADNVVIDKVKDSLQTIFPDSKPIINKLPQILIVFLPDEQFSVTIQNETIVVNDDPQKENGKLDEVIKTVIKLNKEFNEFTLTAYGINHRYIVENATVAKLENFLNTAELQEKKVVDSAENVKTASFSFIEKTDEGREQTNVTNVFAKDGSYSGNVEFTFNSHADISDDSLPEFGALKDFINGVQDKTVEKIKALMA